MSRPAALRRRALSVTAMVGDGLMRARRAARGAAAFDSVSVVVMRRKLTGHAAPRNGRHATPNRAFTNVGPLHVNSYSVVNLDTSCKVTDWATFIGQIDNLLDCRYRDPTGFLGPSLSVFAGLRLTLGRCAGGERELIHRPQSPKIIEG